MTEQELVQGCIDNNRLCQRKLYELYAGKMLVVCHRYAHTTAEAEDILQEAFMKIFEKMYTFRQESPLAAWIKRIVINMALNHIRSQHIWEGSDTLEQMSDYYPSEVQHLADFHFQELIGMIRTLPQGCQAVFNLYAIEGYQHNEIAKLLGISEGTSKSQYSRAKMLLQQMIGGYRQSSVSYKQ
jgi:RNA polymerase sigma factor (sigma-70 family)